VQEYFQQHGASLPEKLESYIASCDRIIALIGHADNDYWQGISVQRDRFLVV